MQSIDRQSKYIPIIPKATIRWIVLLGSWMAFGLFMATQSYYLSIQAGRSSFWTDSLLNEMIYACIWLALTPVVMMLAWSYPIEPPRRLSRATLHLFFSVITAIIHRGTFLIVSVMLTSSQQNPFSWNRVGHSMFLYLDYGLMIYWGLLLIRHAYDYFQRYHQNELEKSHLESLLVRAQLQAMKMQLQPHFLFNTLNAISVLIQKNPAAARTMIVKLSELLRMTLEKNTTQEIRLREELAILDCYLEIEQTRFEDRLRIEREIPQEVLDAFVPSLVLQPIVENAMRHGVARQRESALVAIRAERSNGSLILQVTDNGPGIDFSTPMKEGIGLSTTRQRLFRLYGERSHVELQNAKSGGLVVTMTIPLRTHIS
jgi:two-component system LytT family sensor kinase